MSHHRKKVWVDRQLVLVIVLGTIAAGSAIIAHFTQ